jgi:nitrogen-specific signal transduction histidine kinase
MTFEQKWLEYDYNPFILFRSNGKIISLNAEAQFLLGCTTAKELFELATTYASVNFGFRTTFLELVYGRYHFFGITVGYDNEDEIGLKLYQAPSYKLATKKPVGELVNIYTIVDLCVASNTINSSNINFQKIYDPTIPDIILDSDKMIKLLNKVYTAANKSSNIITKIYFRVGEHIKFDEKKYSLFSIEIIPDSFDATKKAEIKLFAEENNFYISLDKSITINIPMITD